MKIPASIRRLFDDQVAANIQLKRRVDERLRSLKNPRWHYESRLKELESFALKVESGRVSTPTKMEDFFACTLVVRHTADITEAEGLASREFTLKERRPPDDSFTHKHVDSFPFDDLRLYVEWKDDASLPPTGLHGLRFEIQVKTYLQHAWSIATHDLIYKTDEPRWSTQRLAFQIKAMLEHAEVSIQEAEALSASAALHRTDRRFETLSEAIVFVEETWTKEDRPADLRRLAENIASLCEAVDLSISDLKAVIAVETAAGKGAQTRNLSPYGIAVASLLRQRRDALMRAVTSTSRGRKLKILFPAELEIPADVDRSAWVNALLLPA